MLESLQMMRLFVESFFEPKSKVYRFVADYYEMITYLYNDLYHEKLTLLNIIVINVKKVPNFIINADNDKTWTDWSTTILNLHMKEMYDAYGKDNTIFADKRLVPVKSNTVNNTFIIGNPKAKTYMTDNNNFINIDFLDTQYESLLKKDTSDVTSPVMKERQILSASVSPNKTSMNNINSSTRTRDINVPGFTTRWQSGVSYNSPMNSNTGNIDEVDEILESNSKIERKVYTEDGKKNNESNTREGSVDNVVNYREGV